ncbi:hypothetical protein PGB90_002821 [Kerria lacca]
MLSRLSFKTGVTFFRQDRLPLLRYQPSASLEMYRIEKNKIVKEVSVDDITKVAATEVTDLVPRPSPFDSPLRDHVNFPKPVRLERPSPTRMAMFPEEWFKFLYPKMGVTGPYTLGIGLILLLVNKEIYLIDDFEFRHTVAFYLWIYVFVKTPLGKLLQNFFLDNLESEQFRKFRLYNEEVRLEAIKHEKEEQWRQEGKQLLFDAKKENVGLQLEAMYRNNSMDLYQQVKRRLDYQVEVAKIDSRIKGQFMVNWVNEKVKESISKMSEKDNLKQCIANLNTLAAKA